MRICGDRLVRVPGFALLDEERVLHHPGRVQEEPYSVPVAERPEGAHAGHAHRLAARHVDGAGQADVGDLPGAFAGDQALQLLQIHVALERVLADRVVGLGDDHVDEDAARALLVLPGGREVHVRGHELAGADRYLADQVLGAAALVGRDHMPVAVGLADGCLEVVEVPRARVGLVAEHERRPLPVAHRVRARVGEQVDVDVLGLAAGTCCSRPPRPPARARPAWSSASARPS